jgi:hypothetical protein
VTVSGRVVDGEIEIVVSNRSRATVRRASRARVIASRSTTFGSGSISPTAAAAR